MNLFASNHTIHVETSPFAHLHADAAANVAAAVIVRAKPVTAPHRHHRAPEPTRSYFLDQVDAAGHHIAYVGCAPDRRSATRMRRREAAERGCPEARIVFSVSKGI